jgi:6,7-dimethyl-8-ribityllumazine synthase
MKPILLVVAPYYQEIADQLVAGASAAIFAAGHTAEIIHVPGALEIPAAIAMAHKSGHYAGYVALGCVIRGETSHYDIVAGESARGLQILALEQFAAIGNGILTCETLEQARVRADMAQGNKGGEAAQAAIKMLEIAHVFGLDHA